jgi:hypothetical protein
MTFWFDGKTLRSYDKFGKHVRPRFKREAMELGVDWDMFMQDKAPAVNKWNLLQWLQYQEYLAMDNGRGLAKFKAQQENFFKKTEGGNLQGYNLLNS